MAYKNISLSVEAYDTLKRQKKASESFSKEILRLAKKASVWDVMGILSESEADELETNVNASRAKIKMREWRY